MAREEEKLKLGKRSAFEKGRLKRLRQEDETWEADFQALPKPITQSQTHYLGMVVGPDGPDFGASKVIGIEQQKKYIKIAEKRIVES